MENALEWSENCEQMASYWLDIPNLAVAQHLLTCAELQAQRAGGLHHDSVEEREASLALSWAKWYMRQLAISSAEKKSPGHYKPSVLELPETLR